MNPPKKKIYIYYELNKLINKNNNVNFDEEYFYDYFKKRCNINNINYNNILNNMYIILNHNEYILNKYLNTLYKSNSIINYSDKIIKFIDDEHKAHIKIYNVSKQGFYIKNIKTKTYIKFGIEHDIPIPYLTGLYLKSNILFNNERKYLFSYIGGTWRGLKNIHGKPKRKICINNLIKINNKYKDKNLFYSPIITKLHKEEGIIGWSKGIFGIEAKKIYFNSIFSWQPYGDTETRRGFYESILCGNIPIIEKKSYLIYKKLLIGDKNLNKICIILDDNNFYNANYIINYLLNINKQKILNYIKNINNIKNKLQWNIFKEDNAFHDIINKILE